MIKTMNSKMTTNSQLSTMKPPKQKQTKQTTRQEENQINGDHMEGQQQAGGGGNRGKGIGNK